MKTFEDYLLQLKSLRSGNIIIHSGFNRIRSAFPGITPDGVIENLKLVIGSEGSVIFPAFTYCYKRGSGDYEIFDRIKSTSKVGLLSETFRLSEGVIRTSSPTHSFALWGRITDEIGEENSPESPLGRGSVLDWLTDSPASYVLMLGTDFSSLSYCHYIEVQARVPWYDYSPWGYMDVLPVGVSEGREQKLKEIPGCARAFTGFERYLLDRTLIDRKEYKGLNTYLVPINLLYEQGMQFFKNNYKRLLCPEGKCEACDSRRALF